MLSSRNHNECSWLTSALLTVPLQSALNNICSWSSVIKGHKNRIKVRVLVNITKHNRWPKHILYLCVCVRAYIHIYTHMKANICIYAVIFVTVRSGTPYRHIYCRWCSRWILQIRNSVEKQILLVVLIRTVTTTWNINVLMTYFSDKTIVCAVPEWVTASSVLYKTGIVRTT
jgi:hypothetical protein